MKKILLILLSVLLLCSCDVLEIKVRQNAETYQKDSNKENVRVVMLYGQSNAEGCSLNSYLQVNDSSLYEEYLQGYDNVKINYCIDGGNNNSNNEFVKCTLGAGANQYYFGPEMGIAEKYAKTYPNEKTFIIKWAWGGSSLDYQWLDGACHRGDMYNSAITFTKQCLDKLLESYNINIDGISWMQGETDGCDRPDSYYKNTVKFVNYLREDLAYYQSIIKFVDCYIQDVWPNYEKINKAKLDYSIKSRYNVCIDSITLDLDTTQEPVGTPDTAHYDSMSMVKLGREFGKFLINK